MENLLNTVMEVLDSLVRLEKIHKGDHRGHDCLSI